MVAKIITIVNQKGGSGKTTLTMQISGSLAKRKKKVLVVDADPQGTATRWSSSASEDSPFPASVCGLSAAGESVHKEVRKFVDKFDYILIDCPPAIDSHVPQSALIISDLAIIPVIPSPADLWATKGIIKLISLAHSLNEGLKAIIVPNMCQLQTNLAKEALECLQDFEIPVSKTCIHQRNVYRESSAYGQTVHMFGIIKGGRAVEEVESLTGEILSLLKNDKSNISNAA